MVKGIKIAGIAAIAGISNIVLNNKNTIRSRESRGSGEIQGRVKWFNPIKGFGFIEREGEKDVFFHIGDVNEGIKFLDEGQEVFFDIQEKNGKPSAVNIGLE